MDGFDEAARIISSITRKVIAEDGERWAMEGEDALLGPRGDTWVYYEVVEINYLWLHRN